MVSAAAHSSDPQWATCQPLLWGSGGFFVTPNVAAFIPLFSRPHLEFTRTPLPGIYWPALVYVWTKDTQTAYYIQLISFFLLVLCVSIKKENCSILISYICIDAYSMISEKRVKSNSNLLTIKIFVVKAKTFLKKVRKSRRPNWQIHCFCSAAVNAAGAVRYCT